MKIVHSRSLRKQRGVATIFVAMILLIFITLMVLMAFSLSTQNMRAVGNVQTRTEAIAAAEKAMELVVDTSFWNPAIEQAFDIDIDHDLSNDYRVTIAAPACVLATQANISSASSVTLPGFSAAAAWNTVWELDATATGSTTNTSGTRVRVRQGVRVLMSETDKNLYCPT